MCLLASKSANLQINGEYSSVQLRVSNDFYLLVTSSTGVTPLSVGALFVVAALLAVARGRVRPAHKALQQKTIPTSFLLFP